MATIFPNNPVGALTPETVRVFRLLKRLPEEVYAVWQRLACWSEPGPDFWVRHRSGRSLLIKVSSASTQDARNAHQGSFFAETRQAFAQAEHDVLQRFLTTLDSPDDPLGPAQVPLVVLFPNIASADLMLAQPREPLAGISWGGRDELASDRFAAWIDSQLGARLGPTQIEQLRAAFAPE